MGQFETESDQVAAKHSLSARKYLEQSIYEMEVQQIAESIC